MRLLAALGLLLLYGVQLSAADDPVYSECLRISDKLASVSFEECMERQLGVSDGRSVKNAPILIKEYPPLPQKRKPLG
ncbi:MAG TPA: murein peptide amidase A, partial [Gammaproteobacteria bacterium]|nr:murein peptide amidase A [Gammaproteobacteria bacterium]